MADLEKDPNQSLQTTPREFFRRVIYNLDINTLHIETPIDASNRVLSNEKDIFDRITAALPSCELGEGNQIKLRAEFMVIQKGKKIDEWFDEISLADMLINDDLITSYLYMEEMYIPFPFKKKLWLHYKGLFKEGTGMTTDEKISSNYAALMTWYTKKETSKGQIIEFEDPVTFKKKSIEFDYTQEYLNFSVPSAESRDVLEQFILVFKLLLEYYIIERNSINEIYNEYLGEININPVKETVNLKRGRKSKNGNLQKLKEQAPEIFVSAFATKCQANAHPDILTKEEKEQYEAEGKQTIEFPINPEPGEKQYTIGCPGTKNAGEKIFAYVGVFRNPFEENNLKFPYLPCCYQRDHLNRPKSAWTEYKSGATTKATTGAKADKKLITNKILAEGGTGFLPKSINEILSEYKQGSFEFSRYGSIRSPSSFIHSVLFAIGDRDYLKMDPNKKEKYVIKARKWMRDNIYPGLVKQQMYDYEDDEILNYVADENQFLDPNLVYRAVEELFEVNIYTFATPPPGDDGGSGEMEVPRFSNFLCKAHNPKRPTILLLRSWGSTSNKLKYPQVELITESERTIFDLDEQEMGPYCDVLMNRVLGTKITKFDQKGLSTYKGDLFGLDFSLIFDMPIQEQFLDNLGKLRGINVGTKNLTTILLPPSQPLNLPTTKTQHLTKSFEFMKDFELSRETNEGNWYRLFGEEDCIFVPRKVTTPTEYPNPLRVAGNDYTGRINKLKIVLSTIKQIALWAYSYYEGSVSEFFDEYVGVYSGDVEDSSEFYNLEGVEENLPRASSVTDALSRIPTSTSMTRKVKGAKYELVAYNEDFKKKLKIYVSNVYRPNLDIRKLKGYYQNKDNFTKNEYTKLFLNRFDLDEWIKSIMIGDSKIVRRAIQEKYSKETEPYLYQTLNGKLYIVQNVNGGYKDIALTVVSKWKKDKYNPGFNGTTAEVDLANMTINKKEVFVGIHIISTDGTLTLHETQGKEDTEPLHIMYYGSLDNYIKQSGGKYAAMLEVL